MKDIRISESLEAVHTHTHTSIIEKNKSNKNAFLKAGYGKNVKDININSINKIKRIDCLAKVKSRLMQIMHKNNVRKTLLQNGLSFLRAKSIYISENIKVKDKYA